jgi:hypothetical protein
MSDGQDLRPPTAIQQMTPEQATAEIARRSAEYQAARASAAGAVAPPPAGVAASTPGQAAARLAQLKADPNFRSRLLAGSGAELREFQELTATMASGDVQSDTEIETVNSIDDPLAQSRRVTEQMYDGLRQAGMTEHQETIIRAIESGVTTADVSEGDGIAARRARDKLLRNPELVAQRLNRSNPELDRVMFALNWAISNSQKDGRAMSQKAREELGALGLL